MDYGRFANPLERGTSYWMQRGAEDGEEDARRGQASDILASMNSLYDKPQTHEHAVAYAQGYVQSSRMPAQQAKHEWMRLRAALQRAFPDGK